MHWTVSHVQVEKGVATSYDKAQKHRSTLHMHDIAACSRLSSKPALLNTASVMQVGQGPT